MTTNNSLHAGTSSAVSIPVVLPRGENRAPNKIGRVLHLINGEHFSGAERVQDLLAQRLPDLGYDVGFACVKPDKFPEMCRAATAELHLTPMNSQVDLSTVRQLCRITREREYDILHAHTPRTVMLASIVARLTQRPFVYHVHSPTSRDSTRRWQNRVNRWIERSSLVGVSKLITVSHSLAAHMKSEGFRDDQICVVPNGVPAATKKRSSQPPGNIWTVGTVALIRPRKGTEVLLHALKLLRDEGLPVQVRAVGPFETAAYGDQLKALVEQLDLVDAVEWTGFCADVNEQLAAMDLFVLPSLFGEGLPMVVLEAMAAGVPVVATLVEGVPEAVRHGQDGLLAKPGDAADLARAIHSIIQGNVDWGQLRRSAERRHAELFSDGAMAAGCAAVYNQLTG